MILQSQQTLNNYIMKNLILFLLFSGSLIAQQSEVVYENIIITPLKSSENLLIQGIKKHNQKYHKKRIMLESTLIFCRNKGLR